MQSPRQAQALREQHRLSSHKSFSTVHECSKAGNIKRAGSCDVLASRSQRTDSEHSLVTKRGSIQYYDDSVHAEDETNEFLCHKEGYCKKENRRGRFQKRYFVTNNAYLNYYTHKSTYVNGDRSRAAASIDLRAAATICILSHNGQRTRKFAIQTRQGGNIEECFFLKAKSVKEAVMWVHVLKTRKEYWCANEATREKMKAGLYKRERPAFNERLSTGTTPSGGDESQWWQETSEKNDSSSDEMDSSDDEGYITGQDDESSIEEFDEVKTGDEKLGDIVERCSDMTARTLELLRTQPAPSEVQYWSEPDVRKLRIRGPTYLDDKEKIQASDPMFKLIAVDLFTTDGRLDHIASHPENRIAKAIARGAEFPFVFMVHIQVPGPPFYSYVAYMSATKGTCDVLKGAGGTENLPPGFAGLAQKFFTGDDDELRDCRFKLCPRVAEGPFVVRRGVPNKPAILGKKLKQRYYRGKNYLELCVDVGSSLIAWKLTQLAVGYAKLLTVDLAFVLQGNTEEELPEQVLGIVRAHGPDMSKAIPLKKVPTSS